PLHLGLLDIAKRLDAAGVIRSPMGFTLLAVVRGSARSLKAGEYEMPAGATTIDVLNLLEGGRVVQHAVLLREGKTLSELAKEIETEGLVRADELVRVGRDPLFLRALDIPASSVEGYLFPDTYQLVKGMTAEEILTKMIARMRERLTPDLVAAAEAHGLSIHELLTLASIIEREAIVPSELPLISAVFWNRLKIYMPLQADPTVQPRRPDDATRTLGVLSAPLELTTLRGRDGHLRPPLLGRGRPGRARAPDGRFPPLYQLVRSTCALALRRLFGLDVSGLEGLPDKEPFILAANHHNYLDGIVLGVPAPRPISFLVMPRVFHASPLHPAFHRGIGSIPV